MPVTVGICQPHYIPWLGSFDQFRYVDLFVYYDDVELSRKSWTQRNVIKGPACKAEWLTVPVVHGQGRPLIHRAAITNKGSFWRAAHVDKLRAWYREAPHASLIDEFATVIAPEFENIADLDIAVMEWMLDKFGIHTPTQRSSTMGIPMDLDTTARPLAICQALGAQRFLCGPTAKPYIDLPIFTRAGVEIEWHDYVNRHPIYPQLHGRFLPQMSALDYLLNCGPGWPG